MSNISGVLICYANGRPYYYWWEEDYDETVSNYVPNLAVQILCYTYQEIPQGFVGAQIMNYVDSDLHNTLINYNRASNIQDTINTLMDKDYEREDF